MKVRLACDMLFYNIIRDCINCATPRWESDDVLVVEELAATPQDNTSSLHWRGARLLAPVCFSPVASLNLPLGYWWPYLCWRPQAKAAPKCYHHLDTACNSSSVY